MSTTSRSSTPKGTKAASPGQGKDQGKSAAPKATSATQDGNLPGSQDAPTGPSDEDKVTTGGSGDPGTARALNEPQNGPADTVGPGTGTPAAPESSYRMPSTIVSDPTGAPLAPPSDTPTQVDPPYGYNASSSDHVYAEAGGRTVAGEDHARLVDEDGNAVSAGDLFDDTDGAKTFVVTKGRVYEEFYYPNTTEVCKRLLWAAGSKIPRLRAVNIAAAMESAPEPTALQGS